ncbi:MAG: GlsB/YeaQ/YmgE family stress response membrane protein [Comamonadaceae bacterium]|nr:GlsB/YeaQ/YmgE family stress response membrane protein [Comamonadaceae bacterium]
MNFIIWLIAGCAIGWLASVFMRTNDAQGIFLNVGVGVVGALAAGWLISPLIGVGTINQHHFSLHAMLVSFLGASILLAIVNAFPMVRAR